MSDTDALLAQLSEHLSFVRSGNSRRKIAETFTADMQHVQDELAISYAARDEERFRGALHLAKGVFSILPGTSSQPLLDLLSKSVKSEQWEVIAEALPLFQQLITEVRTALEAWANLAMSGS